MTIQKRAFRALNLKQYCYQNKFDSLGALELTPPASRQYVLRMLIRQPLGEIQIPAELKWCIPLITKAEQHQHEIGVHQPFCYLTVRHGLVESQTDDEWHVDGFSMRITHLPEQNYIWADTHPTEVLDGAWAFPDGWDHEKYNIHWFFQDRSRAFKIKRLKSKNVYCFDPYIVHRRPAGTQGIQRTFIRVSFCPIEIRDDNNTPNPLIPYPKYNRDGIKEFRDKLIRY